MGQADAIPVRTAERCFVYINGRRDYEEEIIVVWTGSEYVVGTVLDDWYVVPPDAVKRVIAKLLKVKEEDILLKC
jgi:hypothetical protein